MLLTDTSVQQTNVLKKLHGDVVNNVTNATSESHDGK